MVAKKKLTALDKLAAKKPHVVRRKLCMDADVLVESEAAKKELRDIEVKQRVARKNSPAESEALLELIDAQARLDAAEAALEESMVEFVFRALPHRLYTQLLKDFPPTAEQKEEYEKQALAEGLSMAQAKAGLRFDTDTFPQALVSRCLIEPAVDEETVLGWWEDDNWNETELAVLLTGAEQACRSAAVVS